MPYISTRTTASVSDEKREAVKRRLGQAIGIFPGKSERWLMLGFEDNAQMYFAGAQGNAAFVEVKLLGRAGAAAYDKMTAEICGILKDELSIPQDRIYIQYEECEHWGWNGSNF